MAEAADAAADALEGIAAFISAALCSTLFSVVLLATALLAAASTAGFTALVAVCANADPIAPREMEAAAIVMNNLFMFNSVDLFRLLCRREVLRASITPAISNGLTQEFKKYFFCAEFTPQQSHHKPHQKSHQKFLHNTSM
jgi:hypothetical protein